MAADVRAGLTSPFKELSPQLLLRRARLASSSSRSPSSPEYYPTRCERAILERDARPRSARRRTARRRLIELGSGLGAQDPRACSTRCGTPAASRPTAPVDISEEITRETAERDRRRVRRASTSTASSATSSSTSSGCPVGGPARDRLPRRHDRQLRARTSARGFLRADREPARTRTTASCSAPTWSRTRRRSRPPTTTRRA